MAYNGGFPSPGRKTVRGRYDFAVDGGAQGTITISGASIPDGAIIVGGIMHVATAPTGAGASIAVQSEAAGDIVAAAAISGAPWSTTGNKDIIPDNTGSTGITTTAARQLKIVISGADLTAGVFDVIVEYFDTGDL